jgi:outer membrane immunogenic protein
VNWLATVRGRAGVLVTPTALLYATVGAAFLNTNWGQPPGYFPRVSQTGIAVGGGLEIVLMGNWTGKIEYIYAAFENDTPISVIAAPPCPSPPGFACGDYNRLHVIRAGLNLKF